MLKAIKKLTITITITIITIKITIITITIKRSQYLARSSGDLLKAINKFDFNIFNLT